MDIVMTKRTFNLNLRVSPELDQAFDSHAKKIGQTKSNLVVMLMEAFNSAMDTDGQVVMPLQLKRGASIAEAEPRPSLTPVVADAGAAKNGAKPKTNTPTERNCHGGSSTRCPTRKVS